MVKWNFCFNFDTHTVQRFKNAWDPKRRRDCKHTSFCRCCYIVSRGKSEDIHEI